MLGPEESQDVGSSEESKGSNLESPKQGNSKMKLKSRLSGEWEPSLLERMRQAGRLGNRGERGVVGREGMTPLTG